MLVIAVTYNCEINDEESLSTTDLIKQALLKNENYANVNIQ
jgi:hypothetical protein